MDTPDTENRENSTSFGSGTNTYGDIDTLIREMFSYWDRIKESNPGSVASNEVKDPITMVKDYADSLRTSRDVYWKERVEEERERIYDAIDDYFISPNPIPDAKILCGYIRETLEDNLK